MNYKELLDFLIKNALEEDIGDGDHSTLCCIDADAKGKAILKIKEEGILAGIEVAETIFKYVEPAVLFTAYKKDGDKMCLLYTSPSPRDRTRSRMPSSA